MRVNYAIYIVRLYLFAKTKWSIFIPSKIQPYAATIKLTERCNSRCITCNYWQNKVEDKIDSKMAINIIKELSTIGVNRLRFSGGEPLLRKDLFDILRTIKGQSFKKITLATNGLLLNKYYNEINNSCLTDLGVSIDGLSETNDMIRGVKGYFEKAMEGLSKIKSKRITIMTTLNNKTHEELEELINICENRGYLWDYNLPDDSIYFLKDTQIDSVWPSPEQAEKIFEIIKQLKNRSCMRRLSDIKLVYSYRYLKKDEVLEPHCFMGFMEVFIDSKGGVLSGCNYFPPVGSLIEKPLQSIISSSNYIKRVIKMLQRKCPGCTCGYGVNEILAHIPSYLIKMLLKGKSILT